MILFFSVLIQQQISQYKNIIGIKITEIQIMQQKPQSQQFSQIITPQLVNIQLLTKQCEQQQTQRLIQFILSMQKIFKLYNKPGRKNPFKHLLPENLNYIINKFRILQAKLRFTVYQFKVRKIVQFLNQVGNINKPIARNKQEQQQMKKAISTIKMEQILQNPQILHNKFTHPKLLYQFVINQILSQAGRQILSINEHEKRYEAVLKSLQICNYLIHPTQIQIQISKNTLLQARVFKLKYEYAFQATQIQFVKKAANIINQAILCPADYKIQGLLLKILKRMYKLWGQIIYGPLYLNLRNISLFLSQDSQKLKVIKQAAIFCYSVISSKTDIKFADMLQSSQDLDNLRKNQFFSSKGLALPFELGTLYDTINLQLPIWKYRLHLDKRQTYTYPLLIQKSNTLVYWKFDIVNYDVGFGIYKVGQYKNYQIEQYDKNPECRSIVKMVKYGQGTALNKMPIKGQTFLKSGLYYIIFDNSHSIVRGKDINFQICQLESIS